jgi:FkbM family methyltransferase
LIVEWEWIEMTVPINRAEGDVDQIVKESFFADQAPGRVFVDVGAARPDYLSISALYRSEGWRVIAIDANPAFCELHRIRGYEVHEYACGDHDEDNIDFYIVNSHGAAYQDGQVSFESFSSLGVKEKYAQLTDDLDSVIVKVRLRRLDSIMREEAPEIEHIDILAIDVEGWEIEIIDGLDMRQYKPDVIILENLFDDDAYRTYLQLFDYSLWRRIPPNDVYVNNGPGGINILS